MSIFRPLFAASVIYALLSASVDAADPIPTYANVAYGAHPHQLMDIHLPPTGDGPFPAILWFGGIWKAAAKANIAEYLHNNLIVEQGENAVENITILA